MLTEKEAKTKWCPEARDFNKQNGSGNRWLGDKFDVIADKIDGEPDRPQNVCMASHCMAWRSAHRALNIGVCNGVSENTETI